MAEARAVKFCTQRDDINLAKLGVINYPQKGVIMFVSYLCWRNCGLRNI